MARMRIGIRARKRTFLLYNIQILVVLLLLLVFHFSICCLSAPTKSSQFEGGGREEELQIGYGYEIQSVSVDASGKLLTANLQLIKNSSVYGCDIQSLSIIAR